MQDRDIKGIWIPIEVWTSSDLTSFEKMLLAEIDSFDSGMGCWASSKYLSRQMESSLSYINNTIYKLLKSKHLRRLKSKHKRSLRTFFSRHRGKAQLTANGERHSPPAVNPNRGLKKEASAGLRPRVEFGDLGLDGGPLKLSKAVKIFAKLSTSNRWHVRGPNTYVKGAQQGGWSRQTLMRWQECYKWLLRVHSKETILRLLHWFAKNFDDQYVPIATTFKVFAEKFEAIDRARKRSMKRKGEDDNEKAPARGYWINDKFIPSCEE